MSKRKLLLADDSVTIQKVVNLTFADEDIEVVAVSDGDAAMEKLAEAAPDLVLADVNMPGLDGYRICEAIKGREETKHIPVILLVGSFEPFDEAEARRVGADDFLTKPFQSIRQLVTKVSDLLNRENIDDSVNETVSNFDDTLEMEKPKIESAEPEDLGDAATDDEMIEANQVGGLPSGEPQAFESEPVYQTSIEDIDLTALKQPYDYRSLEEYESKNDWSKTQSLSETDLDELSNVSTADAPHVEENAYEFAGEQDFLIEVETNETRAHKTHQPSPLNFDESDLLELPKSKREFSKHETNETFNARTQSAAGAAQAKELSPEMIDAIADRVAEKISDRVVERVVAQMSKIK